MGTYHQPRTEAIRGAEGEVLPRDFINRCPKVFNDVFRELTGKGQRPITDCLDSANRFFLNSIMRKNRDLLSLIATLTALWACSIASNFTF
jgi:hypothetical protein